MSDRRGIVLLFFDLPSIEKQDRRTYNKFIREVKRNGYIRFQESVYIKLLHNIAHAADEKTVIRRIAPEKGFVSVMCMTLKQFRSMENFGNEAFDTSLFSDNIIFI